MTAKLAALVTELPKDMGMTDGGHDRFELERMVATAANLETNAELRVAIEDIIGIVECLIFLPKPKTLQ